MVTETKLIGISQIYEDNEVYPRFQHSWQVAYDYAKSMETGAEFPPITVAFYAGKYYLVDGKHRKEAYKYIKQDTIEVEIIPVKSLNDIFVEAVKRNVIHGKALSVGEKVKAVLRLRLADLSDEEISKIVQVPFKDIKRFVLKRVTNTITGEQVVLKKPLTHLAGEDIDEETAKSQGLYHGGSQMQIVNEMIGLLETKAFNTKNAPLMNKLKIVQKLIKELILSTRRK